MYIKHLKSLLRHKWYVLKAGLLVGNIPLWRLIIHDWSKFTPTEIFGYAGNVGGVISKERWAKSWLHHLHHNPHHSEHWILSWCGNPQFYDELGEHVAEFVIVLPMPETYVREMVADMMATGKTVTGYWDITRWLNDNGPKMQLHSDTIARLDVVMIEMGYFLAGNCAWSYVALGS